MLMWAYTKQIYLFNNDNWCWTRDVYNDKALLLNSISYHYDGNTIPARRGVGGSVRERQPSRLQISVYSHLTDHINRVQYSTHTILEMRHQTWGYIS